MRTRKAFLILAAAIAATASLRADKVTLQQVPLAAQEAIRAHAGRNKIEDIDREKRGDQVTYEARWKASGSRQALLVSEAGTILRDSLAPANGPVNLTLANTAEVALTDTPLPVQTAIRSQVRGAGVEFVEKGIWNGQIVYQAAYTRDGQRVLIQVNESGQPMAPKTATPVFQPKYAGLAQNNVPLEISAKMSYRYAPDAVKETVSHFAGESAVEEFQRGLWNGKTVYEAAFKKNGEHIRLQVLEDGSLLPRAPVGAAVGGPAVGVVGIGQQSP